MTLPVIKVFKEEFAPDGWNIAFQRFNDAPLPDGYRYAKADRTYGRLPSRPEQCYADWEYRIQKLATDPEQVMLSVNLLPSPYASRDMRPCCLYKGTFPKNLEYIHEDAEVEHAIRMVFRNLYNRPLLRIRRVLYEEFFNK